MNIADRYTGFRFETYVITFGVYVSNHIIIIIAYIGF